MRKLLYLFTFLATLNLNAQNVNIPDANFKAFLVADTTINTNGDTEIQVSEATAYTGYIDCQYLSISDLTGIEAFVNIRTLNCRYNSLTALDITNNTLLQTLNCSFNSIGSLDLSTNIALSNINCSSNVLTALSVTNNTNLNSLICLGNSITALDLTQNVNLKSLECEHNDLTSLNTSNNPLLYRLYCNSNSILSLDLSQNTALKWLKCQGNELTSLNLNNNTILLTVECNINNLTSLNLSHNTLLSRLVCNTNSIDTLDLSNNSALTHIDCHYNVLTSLNVANGNNTNVTTFSTSLNPNLSCIQVDDAAYSTTNWTNIDAASSFSVNCGPAILVNSIAVQGQGNASTISSIGGTLQMEAAVLPANADDDTHTWSVVNGTGSATISASGLLTSTAIGTVEVTATANDTSGVFGTKTITISNQTVGINNIAFENLNVYPNPTSNIINIENTEKLLSIKIMDLTGKTIKEFNADAKQLDISAFTSGIYFLEIANAEKKSIIKIIKK